MKQKSGRHETARILLVDKSDAELQNLREPPFEQSLVVDHVQSVNAARDLLKTADYDAILMGESLADKEGLLLIRETDTPVILASLPANSDMIESAYTAGAADFLCGPISKVELVVRLQNLLAKKQPYLSTKVYKLNKIQFDLEQRQWTASGKTVHLSHHEAIFIATLLDSPKHFCTYTQLLEKIWGNSKYIETQNLRVLAGQLRRKIEPVADKTTLLMTIPGVGYRLALESYGMEPNDQEQ